jgi:hypothetical protein
MSILKATKQQAFDTAVFAPINATFNAAYRAPFSAASGTTQCTAYKYTQRTSEFSAQLASLHSAHDTAAEQT